MNQIDRPTPQAWLEAQSIANVFHQRPKPKFIGDPNNRFCPMAIG